MFRFYRRFSFWSFMLLVVALIGCAPPTTLRFVDEDGALSEQQLRLLCYDSPEGTTLFHQQEVTTDAEGKASAPANCLYVAALQPLHSQPSGKPDHGPAYTIYNASWPRDEPGISAASQEVHINTASTMVLFDVVASLAWEPEPDSPFVDQLINGLRGASAYLYDATEGQMALGSVTIHTGGRNWDGADLRFLSANDYRPTAFIGGMVERPTMNLSGTTEFAPGAIYLGRYWDGLSAADASTGAWSNEAAYRTLIHEWGHYALFLYDEYEQAPGQSIYCTCPELAATPGTATVCGVDQALAASMMAYHYTASEFWHEPTHGDPQRLCQATQQWRVHGMSDWETLARWTALQGLPASLASLSLPSRVTAGPELAPPVSHLFAPTISASPGDETEPSVELAVNTSLNTPPVSQLYLLQGGATGAPVRILHQGTATGPSDLPSGSLGTITLLGATKEDEARLFVDVYAADGSGGRYLYPSPPTGSVTLDDGVTLLAGASDWPASLDATYQLSAGRLTTMTVVLSAPGTDGAPIAQLCAMDAATGCHAGWQQTMTAASPDAWQATFTPLSATAELPAYGVVRVVDENGSGPRELIRWFQVAGGVGPGHTDPVGGFAPLRDGTVVINYAGQTPLPSGPDCNRVVMMPAANYEALRTPLPGATGVIGAPMDIDIILPAEGGCAGMDAANDLPEPVSLTFFYDPIALAEMGVSPNQLQVARFGNEEGIWQPVELLRQEQSARQFLPSEESRERQKEAPPLAALTTMPVEEDGIYLITWTAP